MSSPEYAPVRTGDFAKVRDAMTLTDEQAEAALSTDAFVHVQAPPGSGKTRVIVARIAYLIEVGVDPESICCVTFTRSAAGEIKDRIESIVGPIAEAVTVATFHELAIRLCPLPEGFTLATDAENEAAIRSLYKGPMRRRDVPSITKVKAATRTVDACAATDYFEMTDGERLAVQLVRNRLMGSGLTPLWLLLPMLRGWLIDNREPFSHILVDEAQDVTAAEAKIVRDIAPNVFGVGDPRQAIMGFRGAEPEAFGETTHRLTRTFRFGSGIVQGIGELGLTGGITSWSSDDSRCFTCWAVEDIGQWCGADSGAAILVRTHEDGRAIERMYPDLVRRVRSNERDPLEQDTDRIAEVERQGLVPVLTVHAAKGREWDRVIVVGPSTIRWGNASDDPEERRVLFVAVTRAKKELVLIDQEPNDPRWRVVANAFATAPW